MLGPRFLCFHITGVSEASNNTCNPPQPLVILEEVSHPRSCCDSQSVDSSYRRGGILLLTPQNTGVPMLVMDMSKPQSGWVHMRRPLLVVSIRGRLVPISPKRMCSTSSQCVPTTLSPRRSTVRSAISLRRRNSNTLSILVMLASIMTLGAEGFSLSWFNLT